MSLESGDRKELTAVWTPNVVSGKYKAVVNIKSDNEKKVIEEEFRIGEEDLNLLGVSVNDFKLGDVARIKILVQNKLAEEIKGAFADLKVFDSDLNEIEKLKSEKYDIPASSNKEMVVYWDTESLSKGRYDSELKIDYNKDFILKNFKVDVSDDSMKFTGVGFAIKDVSEGGKTSVMTFLYIIIGVLVLINISWVVWWMRSKKKRKK